MDFKDPNDELAKVMMDVYHYILKNHLDIKNKADVGKALREVDPENFSEERVDLVMTMLPAADTIIKKDLEKRSKVN